jgi:hypothetical protein
MSRVFRDYAILTGFITTCITFMYYNDVEVRPVPVTWWLLIGGMMALLLGSFSSRLP